MLTRIVPKRFLVSKTILEVPKSLRPTQNALRRQTLNVPRFEAETLVPCTTMTVCKAYDLAKVTEILQRNRLEASVVIPNEAVVFRKPVEAKSGGTDGPSVAEEDIFVLNNGSIVGWGFKEPYLSQEVAPMLRDAEQGEYSVVESEEIDFVAQQNDASSMREDVLLLDTRDVQQKQLDKAAFGFGISRSTRLAILESLLEDLVQEAQAMTQNFSKGVLKKNKHKLRQDTLQMIGKLLVIRGELNLYSELIETPDMYWSEPKLEMLYRQVSKNLDVLPRIEILNKKLDYATEEQRILLSTLNEENASKLEWIIIYLILIEVVIEVYHFYEKQSERSRGKD